ncbi:NAD(P)-dependent oxidoreductase [Enemella sp. A6]|uniref:NAD(P)-dependent oxidoreductase n=1 Tax=Enemella sp. A6 TaxID=3440152 RepID=UPI003EC0313B
MTFNELHAVPTLPIPLGRRAGALTAFGCDPDEEAAFDDLANRLNVELRLTDAPITEVNADLALGHRCVSVSHKTPVAENTLNALSRIGVEYVSTRSIGRNHIATGYAASLGIEVGHVDYSPDSVADYTLMLMLMAVRRMKPLIRRTDSHDYRLDTTRGRELRDLTVGVIGTGRIGTAVIRRLRGFGCRVLAHDGRCVGSGRMPLGEVLKRSDMVTVHTPLTAQTHHLLDHDRMAQIKPGGYVVNTGRGALVETEALIHLLEQGHLAGAALDVLEGEDGIFYTDRRGRSVENEALLRLQQMPNVLISPHTAYYTDHALRDTVENSLINCLNYARKESA